MFTIYQLVPEKVGRKVGKLINMTSLDHMSDISGRKHDKLAENIVMDRISGENMKSWKYVDKWMKKVEKLGQK